MKEILNLKNREEFRSWLKENAQKEDECFVIVKRGKPIDSIHLWYLDAIYEALCFGWIDSTVTYNDGLTIQRFSPRRKNSNWTELNKERVRFLERNGLMTDLGRKYLPKMGKRSFKANKEIIDILKKNRVYTKFKKYPSLYQRIRLSNLGFYKERNEDAYLKMLNHTIDTTKKGITFGEWNDYGRLLEE